MSYKRISIMRDPRTSDIQFLDSLPLALETIITKEEWQDTIFKINEALRDKITLWSIIRNLSIILYLLSQDTPNVIDDLIHETNQKFKSKGVFFCNPKRVNYQNLDIIISYKET
ncbi:hypothetical protein NBO_597g0004 [Nosema bombycis CQ1]|uniref:Golgin subfamily A member 7/ERF4 domain-containing protein n=1 Tax=Nosema bombycis (strain CQ1 / CVCC 102059) TaxID=578461 RepID=R0M1U8_NOSB1|nr:hypothetical protein NBO_597g0004 [Nosema bombycis CQ1]|eukprot:EOB11999.1 hypothetical protein NBO_597g0004 [Nosema bombycis CQ1]